MAKLGIDKDFLWEFGKLQPPVQEKVHAAFAKFENSSHAGQHLERISNVRDRRLRSIRIDQFYRGIVLAPESGDSYTLLKVLPHDDAYQWAQRQRVTINRATGAIELRDVISIEEQLPELAESAGQVDHRLLDHVSDADLGRLGIDEQVAALARHVVDFEQLESMKPTVPEGQYDVLLGLVMGFTPEEVWAEVAGDVVAEEYDPDNITAALERSTSRIVMVSGPDELMDVFSYPFAQWRVYLHPAQHRAAYGTYSGPARVTGGPGTGKTVAAMHRAHHLAKSADRDRAVLLTTFSKTLACALSDDLELLIEDDEIRRRIDVRHVDRIAYHQVSRRHGQPRLLSTDEQRQRMEAALAGHDLKVTADFLLLEWRDVVLAQDLRTLVSYIAASRRGRGQQLGARQRERVWSVLSEFERRLRADKVWTHETICREAAQLLAGNVLYDHVIVDEAQDFHPWQWRLLRAAVAPGPDDIFIAGDTHQRIYGHRVSLRQVGIDVAGRSRRLTINYRTTAEILQFSFGILHGERFDDMNDDVDTLAGCRSHVHGSPPELVQAATPAEERDALVATIRRWLNDGVAAEQIGVAARTTTLVGDIAADLRRSEIEAVDLGSAPAQNGKVAVATMHRMKGLEFRCVAVAGADAQHLPLRAAVADRDADPVAHDQDMQRERCLFFVACTRAREQLAVLSSGVPSPLLPAGPP